MTMIQEGFNLEQWLMEAFQGEIPEVIQSGLKESQVGANTVEEMMTQVSPDTRAALERLYELHRSETALMFTVMRELFLRHLEHHPAAKGS